jgi:hypothetical protein
MALSERRAWVFDLAGDFPYSIVIRADLLTFQTMDIRNTSQKLTRAALGGAIDALSPSSFCAGIDEHPFLLRRLSCNSLKSSVLGV